MTVREYKRYIGPDLKSHESEDVVCDWFLDGEQKQGIFPQDALGLLE